MITNLLSYLETTADWMPESIAVSDEKTSLTFREIRGLGRAIGSCLLERGFRGKHLPVFTERSPETFAAITGCLYAGAIYTVLAPDMPRGRVEKILSRLKPEGILCDGAGARYLRELGWAGTLIPLEVAAHHPVKETALEALRQEITDQTPIYTVFTSGSTGEPKAVVGCHRGVIDYIEGACQVLPLGPDTVFGSISPLYYDAWLKEWIPTLKYGARLELLPQGCLRTPMELMAQLNRRRVNTLCWVSSAFSILSSLGTLEAAKPEEVKLIAFASEVFPPRELAKWRAALPQTRFFNLYGPTEATGVCCAYEVTDSCSPMIVGRPFPNTEILLLNGDREAELGEQGEICVLGSRLTLGYLGNDQGGFGTFCRDGIPRRIYRTGDLGRWNAEGQLVFLGRADSQIKHLGHRIELGEIEAGAMLLPGVREAACTYEGGKIRLHYAGEAEAETLRTHLQGLLPGHMLPRQVRKLEALPRLPNGKVDRNCL